MPDGDAGVDLDGEACARARRQNVPILALGFAAAGRPTMADERDEDVEVHERCGTRLVEREFPDDRLNGPATVWSLYCPTCRWCIRNITS